MTARCAALGLALTILCGSCSTETIAAAIPDLPGDVTWYVVWLEAEDGRIVRSTAVTPRGDADALVLPLSPANGDGVRVRFVGYRDADLAAVLPEDPQALRDARVRIAGPADPPLPPPAFSASGALTGNEAVLNSAPLGVELTVSWLPRCPELFPDETETLVDLSCTDQYCRPSVTQSGCLVDLMTGNCETESLTGTIDGRGHITFQPSTVLGACQSSDRASLYATMSVDCGGGSVGPCRLDFYQEVRAAAAVVVTTTVVDVEPHHPLEPSRPSDGYLGNLVVYGDRVAVIHYDGKRSLKNCHTRDVAKVAIYDVDTVEQVATATVPPCLSQLVADPRGDGFLGAWRRPNPGVGRFDADGRLLRSVPLEPDGNTRFHFPSDMLAVEELGVVAVSLTVSLTTSGTSAEDVPSIVAIHDLDSLEAVSQSPGGLDDVHALGYAGGSELIIAADGLDALLFLDLSTLNYGESIAFRDLRNNQRTGFSKIFTQGKDVVVTGHGKDSAVHVLQRARDGGELVTANVFELPAEAYDMVSSLEDPNTLFVSLSTRRELEGADTRKGYIARFDLGARRFIPGLILVGDGGIRAMRSDARGRIWASLTEVGVLARVVPAAR